MKHISSAGRAGLVALLLGTLMAACGGGGGGGGDAGTDEPSLGTGPASGLLPAQPAVGDTLAFDVATLRPLVDQAVYTYHGSVSTQQPFDGYTNAVRQVAAGGAVHEEASNAFNAGAQSGEPLRLDAGSLRQRETWTWLKGGASVRLDMLQLRSPLRVNDRQVIVDRAGLDAGIDLDNDRINDKVDVALWVQVVGEETIDLPNRTGVRAVRVDTVLRRRPQLSRNAPSFGETTGVTVSRWFAPGLGLVKLRREVVESERPVFENQSTEELLDMVRIGDGGVGYTAATPQTVPAGSSRAGADIGSVQATVSFDDHAVIVSDVPQPVVAGFALHHVDKQGQLLHTTVYANADLLAPGIEFISFYRAARIGNDLKVFLSGSGGLYLLTLDGSGQQIKAGPTLILSGWFLSGYEVAATRDGFWVAWVPAATDIVNSMPVAPLMIRKFNADGTPQGQATASAATLPVGNVILTGVAGTPQRAIVSMVVLPGLDTPTLRYVVAAADSATPLADETLPASPAGGTCSSNLQAHAQGDEIGLTCAGDRAAALALDGSYRLVQDNGVPRQVPLLPADWFAARTLPTYAADSGRLTAWSVSGLARWPNDRDPMFLSESRFTLIADLPFADQTFDPAQVRMRARIPLTSTLQVTHVLPMGDRLLVLGRSGAALTTQLVWR